MKKLRFLPSILMIVACVALLTVGVFASNPTKNAIDGTVTINPTNQPVNITVYKNSNMVLSEHEVRYGKEYNFTELIGGDLVFETEKANDLSDVEPITLTFKIENPSDATDVEERFATETLGAFFTKGTTTFASGELADGVSDVITTDTIVDTTSGDAFANVVLDTYTPISPGQTVEMKITINPADLYTTLKSGSVDYNLYVEPYQSTENYQTANAVLTKLPVAVYEEDVETTALSSITPLTTTRALKSGINTIDKDTFTTCDKIEYVALPSTITTIADALDSLNENGAFYGLSALKSARVPEGITSIGNRAFRNCVSLSNIELPSTLENIADVAFYGCSGIKNINIPDGVSIGEYAFRGCTGLKNVNFLGSISSLGNYAFAVCSGLSSFSIPSGITSIGRSLFNSCTKLISVKIPDGITNIDAYAFQGCSSLTSVVIPESVENIGDAAFSYCSSLTSVNIPKNITSLNYGVFSSCSSLISIELPDGLTSIGSLAFAFCSSLTSIKLPSGLTSIGAHAFGRSGLTSIEIPNGVTEIGQGAFNATAISEIEFPESIRTIGAGAFARCANLSKVVLPEVNHNEGVSVGQSAFSGETLIGGTKISGEMYIPDGYKFEGSSNGAFWGSEITAFKVNESNSLYMAIDGVLYERGTGDLYNTPVKLSMYPQGSPAKTYTLPATVESIRRYELGCAVNLAYINVESGNPNFASKNGILYDKMVNSNSETVSLGLITIPQKYEIDGNPVTSVTITDAIVFGGRYKESLETTPAAVDGWGAIGGNIEHLTLGTNVINIANAACQEAYNLKTINSTTEGEFDLTGLNIGRIGFKAFEYCLNLNTLKIGKYTDKDGNEAQMTIGDGFVLMAENLSKIYFESEIPPVINFGDYATTLSANFSNLAEDFIIYVPTGKKTDYINAWKSQIDATSLKDAEKTAEKAKIDKIAEHMQEYEVPTE